MIIPYTSLIPIWTNSWTPLLIILKNFSKQVPHSRNRPLRGGLRQKRGTSQNLIVSARPKNMTHPAVGTSLSKTQAKLEKTKPGGRISANWNFQAFTYKIWLSWKKTKKFYRSILRNYLKRRNWWSRIETQQEPPLSLTSRTSRTSKQFTKIICEARPEVLSGRPTPTLSPALSLTTTARKRKILGYQ